LRDLTLTSIAHFAKEGASISIRRIVGIDQLNGTFKMIFLVSDNGCHIWTIAIR
jgi:hypothetical protein